MRGQTKRVLQAPLSPIFDSFTKHHLSLKTVVSCPALGTALEPAARALQVLSLWKAKGNFASLSYNPGDRAKDMLQSGSCSCYMQLEKSSNAMCVGAGRLSKSEDPEASARHSFHYHNETIPCPPRQRGKDSNKANNRRGCREEEPPTPSRWNQLHPGHPSKLLCMQLCSCKHRKEQPALSSARIQSMRNTGNKHRSKGNTKLYTQLGLSSPVKKRRAHRF